MIIGVVADDITGSNDIGIMFAKSGVRAHVYTTDGSSNWQADREAGALILNTNSRLDAPEVAYEKVFAATRGLQQAGCRQYFNKTCSVFRGNIGAEFDAMLDALDERFAAVILGFPKNGRLTVNGIHSVHGKRLEESEFRNDPIHPMTRSDLVEILQAQTKRKVALLDHTAIEQGAVALRDRIAEIRAGGEVNYLILDVTGQEALETIAHAVYDLPVLCGSSALAEELPAAWASHQKFTPAETEDLSSALSSNPDLGILVVAGSLMPQTAAQTDHLRAIGTASYKLDCLRLFSPAERQTEIERLEASLATCLSEGRDALLQSPNHPDEVERVRLECRRLGLEDTQVSRQVSETLAEVARRVLEHTGQKRVVVAGGETSAAVCERLNVDGLRVWKEIQPGLPSCISLTHPPYFLVLKSGSFGSPDFLEKALDHLRRA